MIFVILICNLIGCNNASINEIMDDAQLANVLEQGLLISNIGDDEIFLYHKYENQENADSLIAFYHYGSNIFGYEISDSIVNDITYRSDKSIPKELDAHSILDIEFVSDTTNYSPKCVFISEPFFVDDKKLLLSLAYKNRRSSERWIYFLEKKQESFKVISFFDFQKDKLYMKGEL